MKTDIILAAADCANETDWPEGIVTLGFFVMIGFAVSYIWSKL